MEEANLDQKSRREKIEEICKCLSMKRDWRKAIMLKRRAYFTSLIGKTQTLKEFYEKNSELALLWGAEMSFMDNQQGEVEGIALYIQLDYSDYECYYIYSKDGKLQVSDTISWQNEVCANEDWNIISDFDNYWE